MIKQSVIDEWKRDFDRRKPRQVISNLLSAQAFQYLKSNDFAFVIGLISDQSISSERAWALPLYLAERLNQAQLTPEIVLQHASDLAEIIREKPALHRFPGRMAKYFIAAANRFVALKLPLQGNFTDKMFSDLQNELMGFDGVSVKKAGLGILIQSIDFGQKIVAQDRSSALLDAHVNRFLAQYTATEKNTIADATEIFRLINPANPALVSTWIWSKDKFD
ncbi:hypothetical protein M2M32_06605 [Weissella cibaria]|uniref:hypothetical protein n=1 Tax=Weissella cibaria TaxID=137591 RepID=UPI001CD7E06A|nr:hypothetical protein [Weissella cibaria]MCA1356339.1 hypothetical protein [Weissella cibaria]MDQ2125311.1 hypothetical protein [Weissella cibaria]MDQ2158658.1 hypothetical protein [Weissella cibaria]